MTTIREVAREAGVSVGTVSNVLNDPAIVSPETCERVMRRRNYRPGAIVMGNDMVALGAYEAAELLGLDIPCDVTITGIDDNYFVAHMAPPAFRPPRRVRRAGTSPDPEDSQALTILQQHISRVSNRKVRALTLAQPLSLSS